MLLAVTIQPWSLITNIDLFAISKKDTCLCQDLNPGPRPQSRLSEKIWRSKPLGYGSVASCLVFYYMNSDIEFPLLNDWYTILRAVFKPNEAERVLLSDHCSTSKPPRLDHKPLCFLASIQVWLNHMLAHFTFLKVGLRLHFKNLLN